jgi:seryl-tRNA synthetase
VIDLKRLRDDPEYRRGIERKRVAPGLLEAVLTDDERARGLRTRVEELRARQNAASKEIGQAAPDERAAKIAAAGALKSELSELEAELAQADDALREHALALPNPADASVPDGGEDDGEVVRTIGGPGLAPALDHAAFGESIGFVDATRGSEVSGSRFAYLTNEAVLVELALLQWVMGILVREGFAPVAPPVLVREQAMEEAGFFPTDRAQVYEVDGGELFLVGTSEVPLSALHRGEILDAGALPIRYAGVSSNFRREAGTYGKDTRGIFRVHQFDKVEMFSYAHPDQSWDEHERILAVEEEIYGALELPYRVVNIAAGDLGAAAAKKYDIEAWLPSEGRYRELTSCSNYLDYSARRLGTRIRGEGSGTQLVHTLNGTACAISRTLVFLFEHYQASDGGFVVPDVLRPYTRFDEVKPRPS